MENIAKQEPDYRNLYELSELNLENLRRQLEQKTTWCLLLEKRLEMQAMEIMEISLKMEELQKATRLFVKKR